MIETQTHSDNRNHHDNNFKPDDYQKVKNYLILLRATVADQKEIGEKFFDSNKSQQFLYENLHSIVENLEEKDDMRIQANVMLKRLYNEGTKYLKYKRTSDDGEYEQYSNEGITNKTNSILALPAGIQTEQQSLNFDILDSLPYIDGHFIQDNRLKEEAKKLIGEQMNLMKKENPAIEQLYLQRSNDDTHLKFSKDTFHSDTLLKKELVRVEKGKKIDIFKNHIQTVFDLPPPSKFHDELTWRNLIEGINHSLQHMNLKNFNLDLLIKYGPNSWKRYLKGLECLVNQLECEKNSLEKKIEENNQQRKFAQIEALEKLNELSEKKKYHHYQIVEVNSQILKLRFKIKKLIKYKKNKLRIKKRQMMKLKLSNK